MNAVDLPNVNFALLLFSLTVATGAVWLADVMVLRRSRIAGARAALRQFDQQAAGIPTAATDRERLRERLLRTPRWIEFPAGFFPLLLAVFLLRSFLFEPFRIPSGSMIPTLRIGDLILVNKFSYGIRLPIVDQEVIPVGKPQRGDVVVFRYPVDPAQNFVKRVIGLPGDTIVYRYKTLTVNGQPVAEAAAPDFFDSERGGFMKQFTETLPTAAGGRQHAILIDARRNDPVRPDQPYPHRDQCVYSEGDTAVTCTVPQDRYFMMGDNRDNSADSRSWGFVPDANLVGKAVFVWMNFGDLGRIGRFQ